MRKQTDGVDLNEALAEAEYKPCEAWTIFSRAEWQENNELDARSAKRPVGELTIGAIQDWRIAQHAKFGLGARSTRSTSCPSSLTPSYGCDSRGTMVFMRVAID